jgi:hypothetical protein
MYNDRSMSSNIVIKSRAIPASSRSKNYRNGTVVRTGGGGSSSSSSGIGSADAGLSKDIHVNAPKTGHVNPGEILRKGMGYEQIFRKMLYAPTPATLIGKLSTANDVEFGSTKGFITYTATRNDNGAMIKAFYDDKEENVLEFSGDPAGIQTATRQLQGNYTKGESYTATVIYAASDDGDINETILTSKISVNVHRKWFAGVCNSVPTTSAEVRALSGSGLYKGAGSYKFTIGNYKTFVICIPDGTIKDVSLERYQYNFMDLDSAASPRKISVEGANGSTPLEYTMYVFSTATTSSETDNFTFKTS